ncbi:MAG: glycosyltransferase family 2 protein [Bacteroidales bacterium]|nr:glycosyltransferase family 2 protein [Bacteroidales bacterium]
MISVIVCTYNRAKYLYDALSHIAQNDYPVDDYEIILVNNNSTDNTLAEADRFKHDYPNVNIKVVTEQQNGLSQARNRGIEESKGEFLVFLDDDTTVKNNYLHNINENIKHNPDATAFGGKVVPVFETGMPKWVSCWTMPLFAVTDKGEETGLFKGMSYPVGANMGVKRSAFEKYGTFDTQLGRKWNLLLGGEEKDFFYRLKADKQKIYYFGNIAVEHLIPISRTTYDYIKNIGIGIGISERIRYKKKKSARVFTKAVWEIAKNCGSVLLWAYYAISFRPAKGKAIMILRKNVVAGFLRK